MTSKALSLDTVCIFNMKPKVPVSRRKETKKNDRTWQLCQVLTSSLLSLVQNFKSKASYKAYVALWLEHPSAVLWTGFTLHHWPSYFDRSSDVQSAGCSIIAAGSTVWRERVVEISGPFIKWSCSCLFSITTGNILTVLIIGYMKPYTCTIAIVIMS